MRTLDEVIKAWSICFSDNSRSNCTGCPYADEDGESACFNHDREDALQYLKAFRDAINALDAERERTIEAYCQWKDAKEKLEAQTSQMMWVDKHFHFEISDNPALDWDELQQMEGKPVWVENGFGLSGDWELVQCITKNCVVIIDGLGTETCLTEKDISPTRWQAYRKERS